MRKLKRKHFVSFVIFAALLFPIPFTALVLAGSMGNFTGFEAVFGLLVTMGMPIMLPAVLGIIAAMLFFMERDNDTLKNLRIIPTSPAKIATAKIAVLYILGPIFAFATMVSSMVGGLIAGSELTNIGGNFGIAIITALLYTTSILPVVIAIVGFNRSYIFSVILTFFYTMFDFMLAYGGLFATTDPMMKMYHKHHASTYYLPLAGGAVCRSRNPGLFCNGAVFFTSVACCINRRYYWGAVLSGDCQNL
ncbi:ABC transporter permease [Blautia sp. RD014234]|nr:ABC transporter permease [Blautia parvula]